MKSIGGIQIFAELKRNEYGATYRGFEAAQQRLVLVKTFQRRGEGQHEKEAAARFEREAKVYARLRHPNLVRLLQFGATDSLRFLALEFVEGRNLRSLLQHQGAAQALPPEIALAIFMEVLQGVHEIHRHNFIHRDLKPENILLSDDGQVKLCDFDLTHSEWQRGGSGLSGSPGYLAPEVILGEKITPAADIFALGVLLYEMLAGARPFQEASPVAELNAIMRLTPLPLAKINPAAPKIFEELLQRLLAKNPGQRLQTVPQVQHALAQYLAPGGSLARQHLLQKYLRAPQAYQFTGMVLRHGQASARPQNARLRRASLWAAPILLAVIAGLLWRTNFMPRPVAAPQNNDFAPPDSQAAAALLPKTDSAQTRQASPALRIANAAAPALRPEHPQATPQETAPAARALVFQSQPWAYLFVDGDSLGMTPLAHAATAGARELVFKKPGFPVLRVRLTVNEQTPDTVLVSLWEHIAQLELHVTPWAEVFINESRQNFSTGKAELVLLPGKYDLRFTHTELGEKKETVFLRAGETRRLAVNMFENHLQP